MHLAYSDYGTTSGAEAAVIAVVYLFIFIFSIIGYLISAFLLMKVFDKAGVRGKWRAWVPIYNYLVLAKLGDISPWVVLVLVVASFVPFLNFLTGLALTVVLIMAAYRVTEKFGRPWPLLLLFLLGPIGVWIFLGILAFGSSPWNPNVRPAPWATSFLADKTVWDGIPVQPSQSVSGTGGPGYGGPGVGGPGYGGPGYGGPATGSTPPPAPGTTPPPPVPPQY